MCFQRGVQCVAVRRVNIIQSLWSDNQSICIMRLSLSAFTDYHDLICLLYKYPVPQLKIVGITILNIYNAEQLK